MLTFFLIWWILSYINEKRLPETMAKSYIRSVYKKAKLLNKLYRKRRKRPLDFGISFKINSLIDILIDSNKIIMFYCEFIIAKQDKNIPVSIIDKTINDINSNVLKNDKFETYSKVVIKNDQEMKLRIYKLDDYKKIKSLLAKMDIDFTEQNFYVWG